MTPQPTGSVTLLFTDVDGSTRLLRRLGKERYAAALDLHRRMLREAFGSHDGYEVNYEGDSFFVAFADPAAAVPRRRMPNRRSPPRNGPTTMGFKCGWGSTGEPAAEPPKYVGLDVHLAARIMAAGHGGQVLPSEATRIWSARRRSISASTCSRISTTPCTCSSWEGAGSRRC